MQIAERPTHETPKFYGWQVSASKEGEFEQPKVTFQGLKFPKSAIWIFGLKMTPCWNFSKNSSDLVAGPFP